MRIWSLDPRYLDRQALVACWRETLLAQAVLLGNTRGYTRHPQLERFRAHPEPLHAIGVYLEGIAIEADRRGYRFDRARIQRGGAVAASIAVTDGQLAWEWTHLRAKLAVRSPDVLTRWRDETAPEPHPLFHRVAGPVASWERP